MANDSEIPIFEEDLFEFEFDGFSVFYNASEDIWFLETDKDDDEKESFIIQNSEVTYVDGNEVFNTLGFTPEMFSKLKEFINETITNA